MKIPNPKFQSCGYNAWFALFALAVVCWLLLAALAMVADASPRIQVSAWVLVAILVASAVFLMKEFLLQLYCWLTRRMGKEDSRFFLHDNKQRKSRRIRAGKLQK